MVVQETGGSQQPLSTSSGKVPEQREVKAECSTCHTAHGAHKAESRYCLFLLRNTSLRVPTPALQDLRVSSSLTPAPN